METKAHSAGVKQFALDNAGGGDWKTMPEEGLYRLTKNSHPGRGLVTFDLMPVQFSCMVQPLGKEQRQLLTAAQSGTVADRLLWKLDSGVGVTSFSAGKPVTFRAEAGAVFTGVMPPRSEDGYSLPVWWNSFLDDLNKAHPHLQPDHINSIAVTVAERYRADYHQTFDQFLNKGQQASLSATKPVREWTEDQMVNSLAVSMRQKLESARQKGRGGWETPKECSISHLYDCLLEHVAKPNLDMVDVANIAGMIWWRLNRQDMPAANQDRFELGCHLGKLAAIEADKITDAAASKVRRLLDRILEGRYSSDTIGKLDILTKLSEAEAALADRTFEDDVIQKSQELMALMFPDEKVSVGNLKDSLSIAVAQVTEVNKVIPKFRPFLAKRLREVLDLAVSGITDEGLRQLDIELLAEVAKKRIILDRQRASKNFDLKHLDIERLTRDLLARVFNDGGNTAREIGMKEALKMAYQKVEHDADALAILGKKADLEAEGQWPYVPIASLLLAKELIFDFSQGEPVKVFVDGDNGYPQVLGCEITIRGGLNSLAMADQISKGHTRIASRNVKSEDPELDLTFAFMSGSISQDQYIKGCMKHARKQAFGVMLEDTEKEGFTRGVRTAVADMSLRMGIPANTAQMMAEELADHLGGGGRTFWTHKASGGVYMELGRGLVTDTVQAGTRAVAYQAIADGEVYIRPEDMFFDGRFEAVTRQQD